jgi:hypothetical protein
MKILCHRGYWKTIPEKNTAVAFERSFSLGLGTETDIRDYQGKLVVSHDIADEKSISARMLFEIYNSSDNSLPLALNIKADGLQEKLKELLAEYRIENYFVFDMSIPDMIGYRRSQLTFFSRLSEYEPQAAFYDEAAGVWLDCFLGDWIEEKDIGPHLEIGKQVCLVSPDLHKRDHRPQWAKLSRMNLVSSDHLMLCTDYPEEARKFFHGQN